MADVILLIMGNTAITPWAKDLQAATAEELSCVDEVVALDTHDANACRAMGSQPIRY